VIKHGQTTLLSTLVSPNTPQVTLLSPNGGEVWSAYGQETITWEGSDADGDPLRYAIQYSADGGATWKAVVANLVEPWYQVNLAWLAGSEQALVRVVASDGVNTAYDQSDGAFTVGRKPPAPAIGSPADGAVIPSGGMVILQGAASDVEDGAMTDDRAFRWTSDREGILGVGRTLLIDDLSPGYHVITLQVTDSDLFSSETHVGVFIGSPQQYLPLIVKTGAGT